MTKTDKEQLRQRIRWLVDALAACQEDHRQREALIERLLEAQDQLMFLNAAPRPVARRGFR